MRAFGGARGGRGGRKLGRGIMRKCAAAPRMQMSSMKMKSKKKEEKSSMFIDQCADEEDDDLEMVDGGMMKSAAIESYAPAQTNSAMQQIPIKEAKSPTNPIPTFNALIDNQHSDGFWTSKAEAVLKKFTVSGELKDATVQELIGQVKFADGTDQDCIYLTLVALFILREVFDDRKDEWELIAKKAKDYLKNAGLAKPDSIVKKFSLDVRN